MPGIGSVYETVSKNTRKEWNYAKDDLINEKPTEIDIAGHRHSSRKKEINNREDVW